MTILLGAIADDFTGATDLANTLVRNGIVAIQVIGVPAPDVDIGDAQAVVIALKSRTSAVERAVSDSLAALQWLMDQGASQVIFKYCSTFDSTPGGNIGPVADALSEALATEFAIVCPAFPKTGRTVYQGHLFVGEQLLSESPMKDHPLTPMRDSYLPRLMAQQSQSSCGLIPLAQLRAGVPSLRQAMLELQAKCHRYGVVDVIDDSDLEILGAALVDQKLITGSSAVAQALVANFVKEAGDPDPHADAFVVGTGRALVLAGSCSAATRQQIERVRQLWPSYKVEVDALAAGTDLASDLYNWAMLQDDVLPVLIYASSEPAEIAEIQRRYGVESSGIMVEKLMGELAVRLVVAGFNRIIVAGGETSGAVVSALGIRSLHIGPEIAPGVPWTQSSADTRINLALKSGNFGNDNFFSEAFEVLG